MAQATVRVLHFADAHIDMANYGRRDQDSALPVRVMDFLSSLDQIIDTAVAEGVDMVLFAGDAYKDRNPQPTFQREWGKRMMRLSQAGIPTLLLVGNHDMSPAAGRAHTLQEFMTLNVPLIHVADSIKLWGPNDLGVPLQVLTVPWLSRSRLMTREEYKGSSAEEIFLAMEERITIAIENSIATADPDLPLVLAAHASISGAVYGSERMVSIGQELVLPGRIVADGRLDYVALGHIHKHQSLFPAGSHPPVVYPGSIERIDFGEAREDKGFVLAEIGKGRTEWSFVKLKTRHFIDLPLVVTGADTPMSEIIGKLPTVDEVEGAIVRLRFTYPLDWEPLYDEQQIHDRLAGAFSVQIQKNRLSARRSRLGDGAGIEMLSPVDLLESYWRSTGMNPEEIAVMRELAASVLFVKED